MAIEALEECFGAKALEKGFVTFDQLMRALEIQRKEYIEWNEDRPIGMILSPIPFLLYPSCDRLLSSK